MANQKTIKKRINSVGNIGKITKALEMVSASKVQKAQDKAQSAKPYAQLVYQLTQSLSGEATDHLEIPLLRQPEIFTNHLYVIVSTNRGLAGSLNTNLLRSLSKQLHEDDSPNKQFITVGKKCRNFALKHGELIADFSEEANSEDIVGLTANITNLFIEGKTDKVTFIYNDFISALTQEPTFRQLLPISNGTEKAEETNGTYTFEPDAAILLPEILPFYLEVQVREILVEAAASEHSARMMAMKNASDNAANLSYSLSLYYNKVRQSAITNEINEITTAGLALE